MCPRAPKQPSLQWYGYAVDGIGFHCLEVEEAMMVADVAPAENEATVIAADNRMSSELLSQDLKALVEDNWDWQVWRMSDTDFAVVFPTKASLNLCKNLCRNAGGIALPVSKISVLFTDPLPHLRASAMLSKVWVHLSDVPPCLRRSDLLLEGTKMLGRPRIVDDESLAVKEGPVQMLFHSQAPDRLPKSVMLYANCKVSRLGSRLSPSRRVLCSRGRQMLPKMIKMMRVMKVSARRSKACLIATGSRGTARIKSWQRTLGAREGKGVPLR
jgi:hypothetical protein